MSYPSIMARFKLGDLAYYSEGDISGFIIYGPELCENPERFIYQFALEQGGGVLWVEDGDLYLKKGEVMEQEEVKIVLTEDQVIDEARRDQEIRMEIVNFVAGYFEPETTVNLVAKSQIVYDWVTTNKITVKNQ